MIVNMEKTGNGKYRINSLIETVFGNLGSGMELAVN